jgi:hypothetical protein
MGFSLPMFTSRRGGSATVHLRPNAAPMLLPSPKITFGRSEGLRCESRESPSEWRSINRGRKPPDRSFTDRAKISRRPSLPRLLARLQKRPLYNWKNRTGRRVGKLPPHRGTENAARACDWQRKTVVTRKFAINRLRLELCQ